MRLQANPSPTELFKDIMMIFDDFSTQNVSLYHIVVRQRGGVSRKLPELQDETQSVNPLVHTQVD